MPFALETIKFIELRVLEEAIKTERYDEEFIDESVDSWVDIMEFDLSKEWKQQLVPQLKKEIRRNLQEGRYYYASL